MWSTRLRYLPYPISLTSITTYFNLVSFTEDPFTLQEAKYQLPIFINCPLCANKFAKRLYIIITDLTHNLNFTVINLRSKMVVSLTQSYSAICKILCSTNLTLGPSHPFVKPTFLSQCCFCFEQFEFFKFILE